MSQETRILSVQLAFELGRFYFAKGDFNKAAFYLENSVAAMEKLDDSEDYNNLWYWILSIYRCDVLYIYQILIFVVK